MTPTLNQLFQWVAIADAGVVMVAGLTAAFLTLTGWDTKNFYDRVVPATGIVVGTTLAAGAILAASRWVFG